MPNGGRLNIWTPFTLKIWNFVQAWNPDPGNASSLATPYSVAMTGNGYFALVGACQMTGDWSIVSGVYFELETGPVSPRIVGTTLFWSPSQLLSLKVSGVYGVEIAANSTLTLGRSVRADTANFTGAGSLRLRYVHRIANCLLMLISLGLLFVLVVVRFLPIFSGVPSRTV